MKAGTFRPVSAWDVAAAPGDPMDCNTEYRRWSSPRQMSQEDAPRPSQARLKLSVPTALGRWYPGPHGSLHPEMPICRLGEILYPWKVLAHLSARGTRRQRESGCCLRHPPHTEAEQGCREHRRRNHRIAAAPTLGKNQMSFKSGLSNRWEPRA